jgi:solute carrier family 35 protein F1/2
MLVVSDEITEKDYTALNKGLGDGFMILGATLYGFSASPRSPFLHAPNTPPANATEEFFVRRRPLYEVVGQLGMWGTLINGIQLAALEHARIPQATWSGMNIGLLVAYTASMFILYTVAPLLYRSASSTYYNISLLTSDFYGLLFGLFLFVRPPSPHAFRTCVLTVLAALQPVLAVLPGVRGRRRRPGDLLLAQHAYVSPSASCVLRTDSHRQRRSRASLTSGRLRT